MKYSEMVSAFYAGIPSTRIWKAVIILKIREQSRIKEQHPEEQKKGTSNCKRALCLVTDTKVPLFKDHFWHFQIKTKFRKKIMRQGSI